MLKSVIVVMVDRVGAGHLGPYGNTWVETPELNDLAATCRVFENALSDSLQLPRVYRSFLTGCHAVQEPEVDASTKSLPVLAAENGIRTALVTDAIDLVETSIILDFAECMRQATPPAESAAEREEQTQLGQIFSSAIDWLDSTRAPFFLWIHAEGMNGAWDAPYAYRERFADIDDPRPPDFVTPPSRQYEGVIDPDELLGIAHAYAGQIALLDVCIGTLLQALETHDSGDQTMVLFSSPRGFAMGEHGCVGACGDHLYSELLHVPLMIRTPGGRERERLADFAQPADLFATIAAWLDLPAGACYGQDLSSRDVGSGIAGRPCACAIGEGERAIRTPVWFLREAGSESLSLYAKPDDRWEVNEVADRCPELVVGLRTAMRKYLDLAATGQSSDLPPLPDELMQGLR